MVSLGRHTTQHNTVEEDAAAEDESPSTHNRQQHQQQQWWFRNSRPVLSYQHYCLRCAPSTLTLQVVTLGKQQQQQQHER